MLRIVFLLSSFALFGLTIGSEIYCPVSINEAGSNLAKGKIHVEVNAESNSRSQAKQIDWKLVLKFDQVIDSIDGYGSKNEKCDGKICEFVTGYWIPKQENSKHVKLAHGFKISYQPTGQIPKVLSAKIISTESGEQGRKTYELCTKQKPAAVKPNKGVYPPCTKGFVKVTKSDKSGYDAKMFLSFPKTIFNYRVQLQMSKPFDHMYICGAQNFKCDGQTCTFNNPYWKALLIQGNYAATYGFHVNFPADKESNIVQMKVNGKIICKNT